MNHKPVARVMRANGSAGYHTALAFTDTLRNSGIAGAIGSVGDARDNARMESAHA